MTTVYFMRHAEADNTNPDGRNRPLTEKGLTDCELVTDFLSDKKIGAVISSPYKRAIDTIPDKMRFPKILPVLFEKMVRWISDNGGLNHVENP